MTSQEKLEQKIETLQQELQKSREQLKNITERSIDGILIVDRDGNVQYSNPAASEILERKPEDLVGQNFGFPLLSHQSTEIEIPLQSGKKRTAEMRVVDTYWENQQAFLLSLRDITARKKEERLRRESLERARIIQNSLFPTTFPPLPRMELGGRYHHAENIGGDFFDIQVLKDGFLLLMADVTGHGLDASLITIFLSTFLRREMEHRQGAAQPLHLLKRLQQDFFRQGFPDDYSLEVFLSYIQIETLEIEYAAAGNIRAFLLDEEGQLRPLPESHGALINNTITTPLFGSGSINLSPRQTLLIYTDGVDEPFLTQKPYLGQQYIKKTLLHTQGLLPIEDMLERILGDLMEGTQKHPKDDMAIFALQPKKEFLGKKEWLCPPLTSQLNSFINDMMKDLAPLPVDQDQVRMALLEAVSNAMVHTEEGKKARIQASWNKQELIISVEDGGPGFDWRKTLKNRIHILESWERGRGLSIIEMTTQDFTLNHLGNKIAMSWSFQDGGFSNEGVSNEAVQFHSTNR